MSRTPLSLAVPDASRFARSLGQALHARHDAGQAPPGHVELLNLIARALGHRNLQSLQASGGRALPALPDPPVADAGSTAEAAEAALTRAAEGAPDFDLADLPPLVLAAEDRPARGPLSEHARKALQQFDSRGRLLRWPHKYSVQRLAMWVLWTLFDGRRVYTEREVNQVLMAANAFGDHVTLRRELINHRLMSRKSDCSEYRKLAAQPDDEARALLQAWRQLRRTRQPRVRAHGGDRPGLHAASPRPQAGPEASGR